MRVDGVMGMIDWVLLNVGKGGVDYLGLSTELGPSDFYGCVDRLVSVD